MARTGESPESKRPITVYLDPDVHEAVLALSHEAHSNKSAWCSAVITKDVVKRKMDARDTRKRRK